MSGHGDCWQAVTLIYGVVSASERRGVIRPGPANRFGQVEREEMVVVAAIPKYRGLVVTALTDADVFLTAESKLCQGQGGCYERVSRL